MAADMDIDMDIDLGPIEMAEIDQPVSRSMHAQWFNALY